MIRLDHLEAALRLVRPSALREVELRVPSVNWQDIGGQPELKVALREAVQWPLHHAQAFDRLGIRPPRGVLLYGPPGCSKTLAAKVLGFGLGLALAHALALTYLKSLAASQGAWPKNRTTPRSLTSPGPPLEIPKVNLNLRSRRRSPRRAVPISLPSRVLSSSLSGLVSRNCCLCTLSIARP